MEQKELAALIEKMTLAEKIGQLVQLTPNFFAGAGEITGPLQEWDMSAEELFQIGSVLGTQTATEVIRIQRTYLEKSRLKIPLLFMADVIHGYETIFPIPLALACTFDEDTVEIAARYSAKEASEAGIQVTFSPMADHVKDPRWGRVLESSGEDPTLSAALTAAYVRGYQGDLSKEEQIASCVKHFIGYGAVAAGRDYNTVDFSDLALQQDYLPGFQAALKADAQLVMTAFNTIRGIPVSGNAQLLQEILRKQLSFTGVLISDWAAIAELVSHRVAADKRAAAKLAFSSTVDIDMMSDCYQKNLCESLDTKAQALLDQSVWRVLELKNKLGLFENPFRGTAAPKIDKEILRNASRKTAEESCVLLKNEGILPLQATQQVLLTGPKADSQDILGAWSYIGSQSAAVSLKTGLQERNVATVAFDVELAEHELSELLEKAAVADAVIVAVGENSTESGEAASKTALDLEPWQIDLIHRLADCNSNLILVLFCGRPLILTEIEPFVKAILVAWFPGSEGGAALANLLYGAATPAGKLAMSFPRSVGQLPLSYQQLSTGRPLTEQNAQEKYLSRYLDEANGPLFAFGQGLSYGAITIKAIELLQTEVPSGKSAHFAVDLKNEGQLPGTETLQLYIEDLVTEVARPTRELKKWQKVALQPAEEKRLFFEVTRDELAYVHPDLSRRTDPGEFAVYIGFDSLCEKAGQFKLL